MSTSEREVLRALLRNSLPDFTRRCFQTIVSGKPYLPNWHIDAITYHLEQCMRGKIRRLIIAVPPRNLKSICASVAFPAFVLGQDPTRRIVCLSYSQDLAGKHARDCRTVMESAWYREAFPNTRIDPRKNTEYEIETTARGYRLSTSVGGTLTGRGGNLIVIDDPLKPGDAMSKTKRDAVSEWFGTTLWSRLDQKTEDAIVLVMQRLHVDDPVGHLLAKGKGWTVLSLPAIAEVPQQVATAPGKFYHRAAGELLHPVREPRGVLDELKSGMGSQAFSAQYQQTPVPAGGVLIKAEWLLRRYADPPERRPDDRIVQSWDTASKASHANDFSVCTTWLVRARDYYLLDVFRRRLEFPDLRRQVIRQAQVHDATTVLIEDASTGSSLIQDLRANGPVRPIPIRPVGDKIVRMEGQSPILEAGHVLLPETAPWLDAFLDEMLAFPHGRFDDQVDSVSQFLAWASRRRFGPPIINFRVYDLPLHRAFRGY